ncbi:hypothetical protein LUQ84_002021 [Hamiltosporidium tvaerminnensis]|nr:hypothetical protein LUQ84_002021 [Hamiltosporidium tvaerminnensis]
MIYFLFLLNITMAVIFHFENRMDNLTIKIDLIENQICQGHFTPLNVIGESFEVIISTEDEGKYYLHNTSLPPNKETHFSFNTYEAQTILIYMKRKQIDNSHVPNNYVPRIELKFDSQFDTFNKEVAKGVRVEPAIAALTNLQKLLHDATIETEVVTNTLNMWIGNFNKLVASSLYVSVLTLLLFIFFNVVHVNRMKKFFMRKKLI